MLATDKMHRNAKQIADCNFMMPDDVMIDAEMPTKPNDFDAQTVARGEFSRILNKLLLCMNITSIQVSERQTAS